MRTAASSYEEALAVAEAELGPEVVAAAQRIADSVAGEASGTEARFLCHGLCETGSTPFLDMLDQLRGWMAANPDEVVTLFIEDHVDAGLIAADVETAGLLPLVFEPVPGEPWPTLGEMIRSGRRLVVMIEEGTGGEEAPWLINGFEHTQDTPYTFPTVESFSCDPNRGPTDAPLLLLNHWLSGFSSLVTDAQLVNDREILLPRAQECESERGTIPNFVAVNYVAIGDVYEVVDVLERRRVGGRSRLRKRYAREGLHAYQSVRARRRSCGRPRRTTRHSPWGFARGCRSRRGSSRSVGCSRTPTRSCPSGSRRSSRRPGSLHR